VLRAGGEGCTIKSLKNKYQEQRRTWKEWLLHLEVSGWGWNDELREAFCPKIYRDRSLKGEESRYLTVWSHFKRH